MSLFGNTNKSFTNKHTFFRPFWSLPMNTPQAETNVDTVEPGWHMRVLTPKTGTVSGHSQDFSGATADSIPGWCGSNVLGDPLCPKFSTTYYQKIKRT